MASSANSEERWEHQWSDVSTSCDELKKQLSDLKSRTDAVRQGQREIAGSIATMRQHMFHVACQESCSVHRAQAALAYLRESRLDTRGVEDGLSLLQQVALAGLRSRAVSAEAQELQVQLIDALVAKGADVHAGTPSAVHLTRCDAVRQALVKQGAELNAYPQVRNAACGAREDGPCTLYHPFWGVVKRRGATTRRVVDHVRQLVPYIEAGTLDLPVPCPCHELRNETLTDAPYDHYYTFPSAAYDRPEGLSEIAAIVDSAEASARRRRAALIRELEQGTHLPSDLIRNIVVCY